MSGLLEAAVILLIGLGVGVLAYGIVAVVAPHWQSARKAVCLKVFLAPRMRNVIDCLVGCGIVVVGLIFCAVDIRRYETLSFFGDDFAFFNQAIWNSLHGRLLENTAYLDSPTILGHHFSPFLLALVPLFIFGDGPRVLSVLPVIAVAVSAFPLYWFARQQIGRTLALAILVAFFLSPVVQYLATGQFYEVMLAMPLLMFAMFFLMRRAKHGKD